MKLNTQYKIVIQSNRLVKIYDEDLFDTINDNLVYLEVRIGMSYTKNIPIIYHINDEIRTIRGEKYLQYIHYSHQYTPDIGDMLISPVVSKKAYTAVCKLLQIYFCDSYLSTSADSVHSDQRSESISKRLEVL